MAGEGLHGLRASVAAALLVVLLILSSFPVLEPAIVAASMPVRPRLQPSGAVKKGRRPVRNGQGPCSVLTALRAGAEPRHQ